MYRKALNRQAQSISMTIGLWLVVTALAPSLLFTGCGSRNDIVVAKVGSKKITFGNFNRETAQLPQSEPASKGNVEEAKCNLQVLINKEVMLLEAKNQGLDTTPVVMSKLEKAKRQKVFEALHRRETSQEVKMSEEAMRDYFTQNKLNEEIRISRIAVRDLEDARAVIEEIKKGVDFAQLAKRRSLDRKSAETGGDTGYWLRGEVPKVVVEKVFPVRVAEIVEPLWWGSYYWVHKVTDRRIVSFEERQEMVKTILRRERIPKRWKEYSDELKKRYRMAIVDSALVAFLEAKQARGRTMAEVSSYTLVKFKDGEMSVADYLRWLRDGFPRRGEPAWSDSAQVRGHVELLAIDNELMQREAHRKGIDRRKSLLAELKLLKEKLMAEELRGIEVVNKVKVTEQEAKKYYQEHLGRYRRPAWVRGVEVLVETGKEARKILELARKGADLGDLAQKYTIREKGREEKGIFLFLSFHRDLSKTDLAAKAFEAEIGVLNDPIKVKGGYCVFKVLNKGKESCSPFEIEKVKNSAIGAVRSQKEAALFGDFIDKLRQKYASQIVEYNRSLGVAVQ